MSEKKNYNVILLSMSTLNNAKNVVHYHWDNNNGTEYRFDGISQLEAGTKCIMTQLAARGESVDRIVIMATKEASEPKVAVDNGKKCSAVKFYIDRIKNFCNGEETKNSEKHIDDEMWKNEWEEKITEAVTDVVGGRYDYNELIKRCTNLTDEIIREYETQLKDDISLGDNHELNCDIEKVVSDVVEKKTDTDNEAEKALEHFKELAQKYELKGLEKNSNLAIFFRDKVIYSAYSRLRYNYEVLRQQKEKELVEHSKAEQVYEKHVNELKAHIKFMEKQIASCQKYIKYLEERKPEEIKKYIKERVYQVYCSNPNIQIRKNALEESKIINAQCLKEEFFKEIKIGDDRDATFWEVVNCIKGVRENDEEVIKLYIDTQGGSRSYMAEVIAITELLRDQNVKVAGRYAIEFDRENLSSEIKEVSDNFKSYELVTAMEIFKKYGKGDQLVEYVESQYQNGEEKSGLVNIIKDASDAILFCDTVAFERAIKALSVIKSGKSNAVRTKMDIVREDIFRDYDKLIEVYDKKKYIDYFTLIEWCYNKKFYQQALTILEAKMPWQYFEDGFVHVKNVNVEGQESYKVVEQLQNPRVGYVYKLGDLDYYAFTGLTGNSEMFEKYAYKSDEDIKASLMLYNKLKNMRNNTNHAGDNNNGDIVDNIQKYIIGYKKLLDKIPGKERIGQPTHNDGSFLIGTKYKVVETQGEEKIQIDYICIAPMKYVPYIRNNHTVVEFKKFKSYIDDIKSSIEKKDCLDGKRAHNIKCNLFVRKQLKHKEFGANFVKVQEGYKSFAQGIVNAYIALEEKRMGDDDWAILSAFYDVPYEKASIKLEDFSEKVFEEESREERFAKAYLRWNNKKSYESNVD